MCDLVGWPVSVGCTAERPHWLCVVPVNSERQHRQHNRGHDRHAWVRPGRFHNRNGFGKWFILTRQSRSRWYIAARERLGSVVESAPVITGGQARARGRLDASELDPALTGGVTTPNSRGKHQLSEPEGDETDECNQALGQCSGHEGGGVYTACEPKVFMAPDLSVVRPDVSSEFSAASEPITTVGCIRVGFIRLAVYCSGHRCATRSFASWLPCSSAFGRRCAAAKR